MIAVANTTISLHTLNKLYLFMNNRCSLAASLAGSSVSCINNFSLVFLTDSLPCYPSSRCQDDYSSLQEPRPENVVERSFHQFLFTMWSVPNAHHYFTCVSLFSVLFAHPSDVPLGPKFDSTSSSSNSLLRWVQCWWLMVSFSSSPAIVIYKAYCSWVVEQKILYSILKWPWICYS